MAPPHRPGDLGPAAAAEPGAAARAVQEAEPAPRAAPPGPVPALPPLAPAPQVAASLGPGLVEFAQRLQATGQVLDPGSVAQWAVRVGLGGHASDRLAADAERALADLLSHDPELQRLLSLVQAPTPTKESGR